MELNEYQDRAMKTCLPSCDNFSYMMLNLIGEMGELASKVAKDIRKRNVSLICDLIPEIPFDQWVDRQDEYMAEAGDILWQLSGLCKTMGWTLEEVAAANLSKLASRAERGKIIGDGDNR